MEVTRQGLGALALLGGQPDPVRHYALVHLDTALAHGLEQRPVLPLARLAARSRLPQVHAAELLLLASTCPGNTRAFPLHPLRTRAATRRPPEASRRPQRRPKSLNENPNPPSQANVGSQGHRLS